MFKSIEYKLGIYLALLIASVACTSYLCFIERWTLAIFGGLLVLFIINRIYRNYNQFNTNILFLLNALENGDYSFNFTERKSSKREKEFNLMLNRIKEILAVTQREIVENERFLSLIIESVSTGIIILDESSHIENINRAANQVLGMPVFTHLNQLEKLDETFPQLFKELQVGDRQQITISNEREQIQISLHTSEIKLKNKRLKVITLNNIGSELEAKEMESWIKLIRVMTHEIMNSIAPITSLTETMLLAHTTSEDDKMLKENTIEALETISHTAKGLISFVNSYRQFSGLAQPNKEEISLIPLLENILRLESSAMENKRIKLSIFWESNMQILADEAQISQTILNLVKNAQDAVSDCTEGQLVINLREENTTKVIEFRNNGEPIDKATLPNIFIPFFTTKNQGSGIGLSLSRYIMRLHGGNLKYHTDGGWTVFSMVFEE